MKKFNVDKRIKCNGKIHEVDDTIELDEGDSVTKDLLDKGSISLPGQKKTETKKKEEPATTVTRPEDEAEAKQAIVDLISSFDKEDETKWTKGLFGKGRKPDATVLTELLGWKVSAKERDAIWDEIEKAAKP